MVASAIIDEDVVINAAKKEVVRRYFRTECDYKRGQASFDTVERTRYLMAELDLTPDFLPVVNPAKMISKESGYPCVALELPNGEIVYGKSKKIISASGAVILNALRTLAGLGDDFDIISDDILMPIVKLKTEYLHSKCGVLTVDDVLIALAISSHSNDKAKKAIDCLPKLSGCEAHATYILSPAEEQSLKKIGINISCQPIFLNNNLFED